MKILLTLIAVLLTAPAYGYTVYCTNCSNTAVQSMQHALASQQLQKAPEEISYEEHSMAAAI